MHYTINGHTIFSEASAKPVSQASSYVIQLLKDLGPFHHTLDFGCGKLRYAAHIHELTFYLTVVDSNPQLDRNQLLFDEYTTVRKLVNNSWNFSRALDLEEFARDQTKYDFALCSNVLSAIPDCSDRTQALAEIGKKLTRRGRALIICQYTNSYFCNQMRDNQTLKYNEGFIRGNKKRASYYGLIALPKLLEYVEGAGLKMCKGWRHNQSAYMLVSSQSTCIREALK